MPNKGGIGETLTNAKKSETKDKLADMPCKDLKAEMELAVEEGSEKGRKPDRSTTVFPVHLSP